MNFFISHWIPSPSRNLREQAQEGYILVNRVEKKGSRASVLSQFDRSGWQHENLGPRRDVGEERGGRQKGWPCPVSQMSGPPPRL